MIEFEKTLPDGRSFSVHRVHSSDVDFQAGTIIIWIESWVNLDDFNAGVLPIIEFKTVIAFTAYDSSLLDDMESQVTTLDWDYVNETFNVPVVPSLAELKEEKARQVDLWRTQARYADVTVTVGGVDHTWQVDEGSQQLIMNAITVYSLGIAPLPPTWRTSDDIDVSVTLDDLKAIASAAVTQTSLAFYHSFQLKNQIEAATTPEQLDAIVW